MRVDQVPEQVPEHSRPDRADVVHDGQRVRIFVDERVDVHVRGEDVRPDTDVQVVRVPAEDRIALFAGVVRFQGKRHGVPIRDALAHSAGFPGVHTSRVCGAARQPFGEAVGELVEDGADGECEVSLWGGDDAHVER